MALALSTRLAGGSISRCRYRKVVGPKKADVTEASRSSGTSVRMFCTCAVHDRPPMLDPQGVADVLVISLRTLAYVREEDETFPAPRMVGRLPRWSYESIREWVEASASSPASAGPVRVPVAKKAAVAKRQTGVARVH